MQRARNRIHAVGAVFLEKGLLEQEFAGKRGTSLFDKENNILCFKVTSGPFNGGPYS
jgi:hypothetical protein